MRTLARSGQRCILRSAFCLFTELKAFVPTTSWIAPVSLQENSDLILCAAASMLAISIAHSFFGLAAFWRSLLVIRRTAFARIHLLVLSNPIGLTPGHLSSAIKREASRGDMPFGSTRVVHNLLARRVQSLFHQSTCRPQGIAAPLTRRATLCMLLAVI